jgi:hypothetical protein
MSGYPGIPPVAPFAFPVGDLPVDQESYGADAFTCMPDVPFPPPAEILPGLGPADFATMPVPFDTWDAVDQLEAALDAVRIGVEQQLLNIENDTQRLEGMYDDLRKQVDAPEFSNYLQDGSLQDGADEQSGSPGQSRSLLVCYFPREANKEMIRNAFSPYGDIESVYLVHKDGKPACYGFVNFRTKESAALALKAAKNEEIVLVDKRNATWHVKAEWTATNEVPKKPKKKRSPKVDAKSPNLSGSSTPPMDLRTSLHGYHPMSFYPKPSSQQFNFTQPLSYTVQPKPFSYTVPASPGK